MAAVGPGRPATFNKSPTMKRILQESRELSQHPDPTITAAPLEANLLEWHFTLTGPPSSPYEKGIYHGRIILPHTYPLRPPSFRFLTPSGRFEVNREICLSISGHHEETWQPAWGIRTALCAIRAFMAGDAKGQVGGLDMNWESRELLAKDSRSWRCQGCGGKTNEEIIQEVEQEWKSNHEGETHTQGEIPDELRLAFREDLDKSRKTDEKLAKGAAGGESSPAKATEKVDSIASKEPKSLLQSSSANSEVPSIRQETDMHAGPSATISAQPASQTVGAARQRVTMVATSGHNATQPQHRQEPVPAWLDKAIVGIIITLAIMILKKLAASDDY